MKSDHPALRAAGVRHHSLVSPVAGGRGRLPSADHGTAVAALMVGADPSGSLAGFAQGARVITMPRAGADSQAL